MRRSLSLSLFALLATASLPAAAAEWEFDPTHSRVGFSVRHMMVTDVEGEFPTWTGTIRLDDKDLTKSTVQVEIDTASVNTRVQKRDDHLRGPDFFDVKKFPKMKFKSTKVEKAKDGKLLVTGDLTIRDVTKPVVLTVEGPSPEIAGPWGGVSRGAKATTTISRKDFGLTWNKALEKGGVLVGDDVAIQIDIELTKKTDDGKKS